MTPSPVPTTYACNPAHSYPNGASCISTAGSLTLVTPSPVPTTFACNPAHSYPNGASCISTAGSLTLVTPSQSAPAPVYTTKVVTAYTTYCPDSTTWTEHGKTYSVTSATTVTVTHCPGGCTRTVPVTTSTPSAPAPVKSTPVAPAPAVSSAPAPPKPVWTTKVVTAYTTYCPDSTTWTEHGSTYTATAPTSVTVTHCPGGCTISSKVTPTPAASQPVKSSPVGPAPVKSSATGSTPVSPVTASSSPSVVPYKGAAAGKVVASGSVVGAVLAVLALF